MYFITVFETLEPDEFFFVKYGDKRTWGYYPEYQTAVNALHEDRCYMHENCYQYAVVEKIGYGITAHVESRQWFKWDEDKSGFFEIKEPECVKHVTNFAIG